MSGTDLEKFLNKEIVICFDLDGMLRERELVDCNRETMVRDIVSCEVEDIAMIMGLEADIPPTDITEDVARAALALFASKATELQDWDDVPEFITSQLDDEVEDAKAAWTLNLAVETKAVDEARAAYVSSLLFPRPRSMAAEHPS